MAGNSFTAAEFNNRSGLLIQSLWTSLDEIHKMKLWLDDATHTDALLTASPFNVPAGDLSAIRPAFADLGGASGLYAVAHGTFTPSGANNYFFAAKNLTGLNYTA